MNTNTLFRLAIACSSPLLFGCASLASASSGHIGCEESSITTWDEVDGWNTKTWKAYCRGRTYFCSAVGDKVACKEAVSNAATAATAGCQYDTQCKGTRICRQGQCTDP